jgi:hypothetical protein
MSTGAIAAVLAATLLVCWAPAAHAAYVGKRAARAYLLRAVPPEAPRIMLRDERAGFFRTARLWVQPARRCHRRAADAVSCRITVRLVPDAAHRARNWWPISCRGAVLVSRLADGRLKGDQLDYACRTIRP